MTNNKKTAIYAGSFDPITLGHLDVLKDGAQMFDKVVIVVADNPDKKCMFTVEERKEFIKKCTANIPNIEIDSFGGLTVEYAKIKGADILLRGLRSVSDFEYERELAQINEKLAPNIKTVFIITKPEHSFVSSSAVREVISYGGDVSKFVSKEIIDDLRKKSQW